MSFHDLESVGSVHVPYNWEYADAAARVNASGFVPSDVGKLARQTSDNSLWMLTAITPTWVSVGGGGSGTDDDAIHDNVAAEISAIAEKVTPVSTDLIVIEDSADSNSKKRVQVGNLPAGSGGSLIKLFQGNDYIGGQSVTSALTPIPLPGETIKDDYYDHDTTINNSDVTILQSGLYKLTGEVAIETSSASGSTRSAPRLDFEVWDGSSWGRIWKSTRGYVREDSSLNLSTSLSITTFHNFNANDKIRLVVQDENSPSVDMVLMEDGSRLLIEFIR